MASPAEIARILPDTLPQDFSEWDSDESSGAQPAGSDSSEGLGLFAAAVASIEPFSVQPVPAVPKVQSGARAHEVEALDEEPSPMPPTIYPEQEALLERLRSLGLALKSETEPAPQMPVSGCVSKEVLYPEVRSNGAAANGPANVPSVLPPSTSAEEEAFFNQLRAIGAVLNSQPIKPAHKPSPFRALTPVRRPTRSITPEPDSEPATTPWRSITPAPEPVPAPAPARAMAPEPEPEPAQETARSPLRLITPAPEPAPATACAIVPEPEPEPALETAAAPGVSVTPAPEPIPAPVLAIAPDPEPEIEPAKVSSPEPEFAWALERAISGTHQPASAPLRITEVVPSKPAASEAPVVSRWPEPFRVAARIGLASTDGVPMFRSDLAGSEEETPRRKTWIKAGSIGAASIVFLVLLGVRMLSAGKPTLAKQSLEPTPTSADAGHSAPVRKPSPSTQYGSGRLSAAAKMAGSQAADNDSQSQVDSQLMSEQLSAAPRIPQDIKMKAKQDAPPPDGFDAASPVEMAGVESIGGVLSGQASPTVQYVPYPVVTIPAAVAEGLLIQKTKPVYPSSAWYSGVTGKVVFEATVSRTGEVEYVRFVSGPTVFRQAALAAVKTWHFRPYILENVPREFRTTIEVLFDQNGPRSPLSLFKLGSHSNKDASASGPEAAGAP